MFIVNCKETYVFTSNCCVHVHDFTGGMFEYVSGANYFGESLEWTGYAIACWNAPATAFAAFTCLFLGSRALQHHRCVCVCVRIGRSPTSYIRAAVSSCGWFESWRGFGAAAGTVHRASYSPLPPSFQSIIMLCSA